MLPNVHDLPAGVDEPVISISIASAIGLDLFPPKVRIVNRPRRMLRTAMPKTPVYEDCDTGLCEDEICSTPQSRKDGQVDSVSQAALV